MEANTVSAVTELLVNILLGSFSLLVLSWILVGVQEFINNRKREKREEFFIGGAYEEFRN